MTNLIRTAGRVAVESARSRLWPVPVLGITAALALGIFIPRLDALVDQRLPGWVDALIFSGDAGAARTVLDAVSSSLITVTALTFSLTVVTLQLASSQYSPRLLRTFTKDLFVQVTLALFLGTFTFSLTVLRSVRSSQESAEPFVPRIAVTVSFLLAVTSVIALVLFLAHLTRQIRVETVLANVHQDATDTATSTLQDTDTPEQHAPLRAGLNAVRLLSVKSGFLLRVDEEKIVEAANSCDAFIRIDRPPGSFVVAGTPVATAWRNDKTAFTADQHAVLEHAMATAFHMGPERTGTQDVGFGLRQMVDVATKALSPGINDPTTAIHALGHVSAFLCELTRYQLGPLTVNDTAGTPRAEFSRATFRDYLDVAITQPRRYGRADPLVVTRLLQILEDLAWTAPHQYAGVVLEQLQRIEHTTQNEDFDSDERAEHHQLAAAIRDIIIDQGKRPAAT